MLKAGDINLRFFHKSKKKLVFFKKLLFKDLFFDIIKNNKHKQAGIYYAIKNNQRGLNQN